MGARLVFLSLLLLVSAAPLRAQAPVREDLRYIVEQPLKLRYSMVSLHHDGDAAPRADEPQLVDMEMARADGAIRVRLYLPSAPADTLLVTVSPTGRIALLHVDEALAEVFLPVSTPLLDLPNRAVGRGESWTDTVRVDRDEVKFTTVVRGTYERDSVVAGKRLMVLRLAGDSPAPASGTPRSDEIRSIRREFVLWDPERRVVTYRDADLTIATGEQGVAVDLRMHVVWRLIE